MTDKKQQLDKADALPKFLESTIPHECVVEYIRNYSADPNVLKSVLLDDGFIQFIRKAAPEDLSGIRVYLARYSKHSTQCCQLNDDQFGKDTVIIAATQLVDGKHQDILKYYNYGNPCPPGNCEPPPLKQPTNEHEVLSNS